MTRTTALRAIAPLALMGTIYFLSAQESVGPELPAFTRVIAHFTQYAFLAGLWAWALTPDLRGRALWVAALISALYAVSDEYHQSFVEGRDSDLLDVAADWAGIAFGLWLFSRSGAERADSRRPPTSR